MKKNTSQPLILAIDTSCDDTSAAVTGGFEALANVISSQTALHQPYGGVFPTVAKQAHLENIEPAVQLALKRAGVTADQISAVAITVGPGLAPALEVGLNYAKKIAGEWQVPLLPVNHLEGHLLSVLAKPRGGGQDQEALFPALGLIISGGHSEFVLVEKIGQYQRLGQTIDDAAGEALDKIGRLMDLGYPAGPVIEEWARRGDSAKYPFPLPMTTSGDYNLSFSGLKTFARNLIEKLDQAGELKNPQTSYDLAASAQEGVFRHLDHKLTKILEDHPEIKQVWLGGGVAANTRLRQIIRARINTAQKQAAAKNQISHLSSKLLVPYTKRLCQDNAVMIGVVGGRIWRAAQESGKLDDLAAPDFIAQQERRPNWSLDELKV